jgi:hypothetical protein
MGIETLDELPHYNGWLYGSLWGVLVLIVYFLRKDRSAAVQYTVDAPEQIEPGWKGKALEETTLKVVPPNIDTPIEVLTSL